MRRALPKQLCSTAPSPPISLLVSTTTTRLLRCWLADQQRLAAVWFCLQGHAQLLFAPSTASCSSKSSSIHIDTVRESDQPLFMAQAADLLSREHHIHSNQQVVQPSNDLPTPGGPSSSKDEGPLCCDPRSSPLPSCARMSSIRLATPTQHGTLIST